MDLQQGAAYYPTATVRAVSVDEMNDCDAVVIAAGKGGGPQQSRLELLRENAAIVSDIARKLAKLRGVLIVVTNPVDVLTHVAMEASGLEAHRVVGTGTMLDSARLRQSIASELDVDPRSVHAQVVGEHGDSEVVLWSSATVGGIPLRRWDGWNASREQAIATGVRRAAYEIIARKGATNHAIGLVTAELLRVILRDERRVVTLSQVHADSIDTEDVAFSLPCVVGQRGVETVIEPHMDPSEASALLRSKEVLAEAKESVGRYHAAGN